MKKLFLIIVVGLFIWAGCESGPTESPMKSTKPIIEKDASKTEITMPQYTVLKENIYDAPIKTQITLWILVQSDTTEQDLRNLFNQLYLNLKTRSGFKYHPFPTNIYIYAYTSKKRYEKGTEYWIIMLEKSYDDTTPRINYPNPLRYF